MLEDEHEHAQDRTRHIGMACMATVTRQKETMSAKEVIWPASMLENNKQRDKAAHPSVWSDPRFVYQGLPSPWSIKENGRTTNERPTS